MSRSRIDILMTERRNERLSLASRRAVASLDALERAGFPAWVVGSLAKGTFAVHSDVDFLVDCDPATEMTAFRILEHSMRDFPFNFIPTSDLDDTKRKAIMKEAVDASRIRSYAH